MERYGLDGAFEILRQANEDEEEEQSDDVQQQEG